MSDTDYLTTADIAAWFDVEARTVVKWRERYPDFPEPDVRVGSVAGWRPSRETEIRDWHASRPGSGTRTDLT